MSSTSKAWLVAASVGAVEALKDQGFCRWNYTIRSLHHHVKNNLKSSSSAFAYQTKKQMSTSTNIKDEDHKARQSEESLRKVMYLSCWGLN